jgi:hypothetical protein
VPPPEALRCVHRRWRSRRPRRTRGARTDDSPTRRPGTPTRVVWTPSAPRWTIAGLRGVRIAQQQRKFRRVDASASGQSRLARRLHHRAPCRREPGSGPR